MCGINGQINFTVPVEHAHIIAMSKAIKHRGPDGEGVYLNSGKTAGLGHRRLAFLDLSEAGKQPMCNEDGNLWISYNGEVYNYIELRKELEQCGYRFKSKTDTEVILYGYEEWGDKVLQKLSGMFAFAIWDERKQELFLARDRFGIKPVYYSHQHNNFLFASEIKAIKANPTINTSLNFSALADFFVYRYVPSPKTIWNEIQKLPPAHFLLLKANGSVQITKYWQVPFRNEVISEKDAVEKFDEMLLRSVKTHARSDVPVGSLLSGGYDSTAIVYYLNRFNYTPDTFSIGFSDWAESEHQFAETVAAQYATLHHSLVLHSQSLDTLAHLAWVYDEPIGDISTIPSFLVYQEAAKHVKAVMGGDGADEMLGGYQWQKEFHLHQITFPEKLKWLFSRNNNPQPVRYYANAMAMGRFDTAELQKLLHPDLHTHLPQNPDWFYKQHYNKNLPALKGIQQMDINCFMGELLMCKVDRASMANSLEVRVPFLDHQLVEFVAGLHTSVFFRKNTTKHLLYQNIKKHLPSQILNRKKQGFVGPDKYYMDMLWYENLLHESKLATDKIISADYVQHLLNTKDHWRLWKVAVMEAWYKRWC